MFGLFNKISGSSQNTQIRDAIINGAILVDVRTAAEFSAGGINKAANIPLDQFPSQWATLKDWKSIIVFCTSGNRSNQAKRFLESKGMTHIIDGGPWQNLQKQLKNS